MLQNDVHIAGREHHSGIHVLLPKKGGVRVFKENVVGQSYLCVKLEKHVEISTQEGSQILSELVFFKGVWDSRVGSCNLLFSLIRKREMLV